MTIQNYNANEKNRAEMVRKLSSFHIYCYSSITMVSNISFLTAFSTCLDIAQNRFAQGRSNEKGGNRTTSFIAALLLLMQIHIPFVTYCCLD